MFQLHAKLAHLNTVALLSLSTLVLHCSSQEFDMQARHLRMGSSSDLAQLSPWVPQHA